MQYAIISDEGEIVCVLIDAAKGVNAFHVEVEEAESHHKLSVLLDRDVEDVIGSGWSHYSIEIGKYDDTTKKMVDDIAATLKAGQ
jgi:hypothetical protein